MEGARGGRDDTIWQRGAHKCDILWQRDEQWEVGRRVRVGSFYMGGEENKSVTLRDLR